MKKLGTLLTTTLIATLLLVAAPTAVAGKDKGSAKDTVALCKQWAADYPVLFEIVFGSHGACVATMRSGKYKGPLG